MEISSQLLQKRRWLADLNLRIFKYRRSVANAEQETLITSNWCPEERKRPTVHVSV